MGLEQMGNGQTSPETGTVAAVEEEEFGRHFIVQRMSHDPPQVLVCPFPTEPGAFETQERDLIERVYRAQAVAEFEAVDDLHAVVEPDMLGAQVAVTVDETPLRDALSKERRALVEKPALRPIRATDQSPRQYEARIEQGASVLRQARVPFAQVGRRRDRYRLGSPIEPAERHDQPLKPAPVEPALPNKLVERKAVIEPAHHDEPIDDGAGTADCETLRRDNERNNAQIDICSETAIQA
jgi:hypothetical protein